MDRSLAHLNLAEILLWEYLWIPFLQTGTWNTLNERCSVSLHERPDRLVKTSTWIPRCDRVSAK